MEPVNDPASQKTEHQIQIPNTDQEVTVEVELIPVEDLEPNLERVSNVARVKVGGKEFYAVVGKTRV